MSLGNIFYNKDDSKMTIPNMGAIIDPNDPASLASALGKEEQEKTSPDDSNQEDDENDVSDSEDDDSDKSNEDEDIKDE